MARSDWEAIAIWLVIASWVGGLLFAHWAPAYIKKRHIRRQDKLMERARAMYLLGVAALSWSDTESANSILRRIRSVERRWRYGFSIRYRCMLAIYAIAVGFVGNLGMRIGSMELSHFLMWGTAGEFVRLVDMVFLAVLGTTGALHALGSYFGSWRSAWIVDDCGDRLERHILSPRDIEVATPATKSEPVHSVAALTPIQLFGLRPGFSLKELSAARRRLAASVHPDRFPRRQRAAAEEAMKKINATYDQLRARCLV